MIKKFKLGIFESGIYLNNGKKISKNNPIEKIIPKGNVVYPMTQHIGELAR